MQSKEKKGEEEVHMKASAFIVKKLHTRKQGSVERNQRKFYFYSNKYNFFYLIKFSSLFCVVPCAFPSTWDSILFYATEEDDVKIIAHCKIKPFYFLKVV